MTEEDAQFVVDMYTMWRDQKLTKDQEELLTQAFRTLKKALEASKVASGVPRVQLGQNNAT